MPVLRSPLSSVSLARPKVLGTLGAVLLIGLSAVPSALAVVLPSPRFNGPTAVPPLSPSLGQPLTPVSPAWTAAEGDGYVLGGGDRLRVDIFGVPEFSGEYQVLPNGTVNLPRIGAVVIGGLTLRQATDRISRQYSNYLTRPITTLSLISGRPVRVALAGEVNRPGTYVVTVTGTVNIAGEVPTLSRILQLGEGPTLAADLRSVQVTRIKPGTGVPVTYTVDLWQLLQNGAIGQDLRLQDGDSVMIPPATTISLADTNNFANGTIFPRTNRPLRITVVGEVNRPGPYTIADGQAPAAGVGTSTSQTPSITQAIQVAGGITQMADLSNIRIRRMTRSGRELAANVDFWKLIAKGDSGDTLQDLPLQNGDRIEVGQATSESQARLTEVAKTSFSPDRIAVNMVGEVVRTGPVSIPPNAPLNQAILAAGGFDKKRAQTKSVTLVRLEPNGAVSKRSVSIDLGSDVNEKTNPALRNGDTIIVDRSGVASTGDAIGTVGGPLGGIVGILRLLGIVR
jgi:polysaccharide biosynthesis/export protein